MSKDKNEYSGKSITVLTDREHLRARPGMYVGSVDEAGCFHIWREVFDNAADEFQNGHAKSIFVKISDDCMSAVVRDDGRGIPVDIHPKTKQSTLTTALTVLKAGGKFDKKAYSAGSSGLHGVGVKATNALSDQFVATVWRDGKVYRQTFEKGKPTSKVTTIKPIKGIKLKHGTQIEFTPDLKDIFKKVKVAFNPKAIRSWLASIVHLCPGLTVTFSYKGKEDVFHSKEGLGGYVMRLAKNCGVKVQHDPIVFENAKKTVRIAFAWSEWTTEAKSETKGFVNLAPTPEGGTHINGFRKAVVAALRGAFPKTEARPDDLLDNVFAVVAVKVAEPTFRGQTKGALGNTETEKIVADAVKGFLDDVFSKGKGRKIAKAVCERAKELKNLHENNKKLRAAANSVSVKGGEKGALPEKLAASSIHCPPKRREIFIVEGQSAGGSAKEGRDRFYQEILPLKGKIVNAMRTSVPNTMKNAEVVSIVRSIGIKLDLRDPKKNDLTHLRVGRICLLMDADPDGQHIAALALTFMIERCPQLIEQGYVYVVKSPLFRGVSKDGKHHWFADSIPELETKSGKKAAQINVSRLKGHGEADAHELAEYAMNPKTRRLLKVELDTKDVKRVRLVMGEDAAARKSLLGIEEQTA